MVGLSHGLGLREGKGVMEHARDVEVVKRIVPRELSGIVVLRCLVTRLSVWPTADRGELRAKPDIRHASRKRQRALYRTGLANHPQLRSRKRLVET